MQYRTLGEWARRSKFYDQVAHEVRRAEEAVLLAGGSVPSEAQREWTIRQRTIDRERAHINERLTALTTGPPLGEGASWSARNKAKTEMERLWSRSQEAKRLLSGREAGETPLRASGGF
jgi:hypothetical protein